MIISVQSLVLYCIAVEEQVKQLFIITLTVSLVEKTNELCLDEHNLPRNPLINSGAILAVH